MSTPGRLWLRRLTALLLIVGVGGVVGWAVYRGRINKTPVIGVNPGGGTATSEEGVISSVHEEFEVTETVAGQLIFNLISARSLGLSSGWQEIEGVRLQLYSEGESNAVLNCDSASFNIKTHDARLRGSVHVEFERGGFMQTERGRYDATSRRFISEAKTVFAGGQALGQAGSAIYVLDSNRLILEENVIIRMENGQTLHAPQILYNRKDKTIVFNHGCRIEYPSAWLEAPKAIITLAEVDGPPVRMHLFDGVSFSGSGGGLSLGDVSWSEVTGWAGSLLAQRDAAGRWQVVASTSGPWVEVVMRGGPDTMERSIKTWRLHAVIGPKGILNMRTSDVVCIKDIPYAGSPRWASARISRTWFKDGVATDMELEDEVVLRNETASGSGARARLKAATGIIMLFGDSSGRKRATLLSGRGQVTSDQLRLTESEGKAEARGNVQGRLEQVTLLGGGAQSLEEEGPMHFAGGALDAEEGGAVFRLKDNARAWQGQRFIFADELVFRQGDESLEALGHVRTTLPARQVDPSSKEASEVLVVARSLSYNRGEQYAVFRGNVRFTDELHILSAAELWVRFDAQGGAETIEAIGSVDILELSSGRRMTGQRARRECASQIVHVSGSPVQVTDEKGNRHSGTSLTWEQASGRVSIAGGPDSQTETIFYPEEKSPEPKSTRSENRRSSQGVPRPLGG